MKLLRNPYLFLVLFAVGAGLLFLFDHTITILVGVVLQLAAVVAGVFAIATPEFLSADPSEAESASATGDSEKTS